MVESRWSDKDAQAQIDAHAGLTSDAQLDEDLALRVYTSRLIGQDDSLVLHGGGNTSVKSRHTTILGDRIPAIYVKGSGWDLGSIEAPGFPGLDLEYLRTLRALEVLGDEAMVNELRTHMFDASGPTPSVETLLHAFFPPKFVDHSHADAIIALTNRDDSAAHLAACFGDDVSYVPYVMPGFALAKAAADVFDAQPDAQGMVLLNHGLFTWGETAQESYARHVALVRRAEAYLEGLTPKRVFETRTAPVLDPLDVLPALRGALALRGADGVVSKRFVCEVRTSDAIEQFVNAPDLLATAKTGPLTPDHILRTKELPLIVEVGEDGPAEVIGPALAAYESAYDTYFAACRSSRGAEVTKLDPKPRIVLVPGLGLVAVGNNAKAAAIAADIYEHTIDVKARVTSVSEYRALPQLDLFDVEYWSLEQAKLGKQSPKPLEGQVALITGGAGAIGLGVARVLKENGAEVVLTDIDGAEEAAVDIGGLSVTHDATSPESTRAAFEAACLRYGGVDIVVPNAGIALSAPITELDPEACRRVMDVNFQGYLNTVQAAARVMIAQGTVGNIVIVSSKNVLAPGKEFAIYSASKAAGHQLGKVAALELAEHGIRVNMVTPDAVFNTESDAEGSIRSGLWREVGPARAQAHGITPEKLQAHYQTRNLLNQKITAEDVGRAVLYFATDQTPTTGATLPVDGGISQAFPR